MIVIPNRGGIGATGKVSCLPLMVALAMAASTVSTPAPAQAQEEPAAHETRVMSSMSEAVYKDLARAQDKAKENRYDEALKILDKLAGDKSLNSYERAQVWNLYAFVYHAQEKYPETIEALRKVLGEEELDEVLEASTVYSLAVLYFETEQWRDVIAMVNRWIPLTSEPKPQAYELLAETHYQLAEYRDVVRHLKKAIELRRAAGQEVAERSYLLLRAAHSELKEHDQAAAILEELIGRFPKGDYWMQLAAFYGEAGDERNQLNTLELAYLQGYLKESQELLSLAGLLLRNDLPYRAGKVLEKGLEDGVLEPTLENWRLLSQAWTLAQEDRRALPALTRATQLSKDGELDIVLAQTYINLAEWEPAAAALRAGIRKGELRRPDQANVMLGQVLFALKAFEESRAAFQQALADGRSRQLAGQWLTYIDSELDRQAKLKAALEE